MEKINLTIKEKKELEKRGFFVRTWITLNKMSFILLIHTIPLVFLLTILTRSIIPHSFSQNTANYLSNSLNLGVILLYIWICLYYLLFHKIFYSEQGTFLSWQIKENIKKSIILKYISWINNGTLEEKKYPTSESFLGIIATSSFLILAIGLTGSIYTTSLIILCILLTFCFVYFAQYFHPLYAFGNLGEKIQKLTPKISETSISIQENFSEDMNFKVLSDGFDSLSSTFSQIISLVIKLEKIESRANKGNLFDSEKYINSLRTDITEPLISLKIFLEKQKIELIQSNKELTRVRVGGSEPTGNIELQSKRSESLIVELSENIEKLDEMIGKMG